MEDKINDLSLKLSAFDEKFIVNNNEITIVTESPLFIYVKFENNKYLISNRLMKWDFLTGFLKISLREAYRYLTSMLVLGILLIVLFYFFISCKDYSIDLNTLLIFLSLLVIIISWTAFSFLKLKISFLQKKKQIIDWINE